ncbi:hypothetical protein M422DRAFT_785063 [Sphaerobolus stellatus SS14]|uniref:Uncharacterized protein n=1 Tax=Sphaerobolus stellatus (strain SS14) TaxID=990650 RepID=A0A0C9TYR7_SPHS4|nr:hypothetical protein M422DRAFT_785063 [Sphaerobolus stellatus SS14]
MAAYGGAAFPGAGGAYGYSPAPSQQPYVEPGTLVFTREVDSVGRKEYHIYRAEPRTINSINGPIDGMQWVPIGVYDRPPVDAVPAGPDFHAAWGRQMNEKEHQKAVKEWQREQDKTRKEWEREHERLAKDEQREAAKKMKEWEKERRARERAEEEEFRHNRRGSDVGWGNDTGAYPQTTNYRGRSRSRVRTESFGQDELARKFAAASLTERARSKSRSRRASFNEPAMPLSQAEYSSSRGRRLSTAGYPQALGGPPSPALRAQSNRGSSPVSFSTKRSPYIGGGGLPSSYKGGEGAYYGHQREVYDEFPPRGGSVSGSYRSRSPIPGGSSTSYRAPSPRLRQGSMSARAVQAPDAFSRPPSQAMPYTYFDSFAILRDLQYLYNELPPLPAALLPHDVYHHEWDQCLEDVRRAWYTKGVDAKKRDKLLSRIIDVWNALFFAPRGVELILLRGSQHRSGRDYGRYDPELAGYADDYDSEDSDTLSSISTGSDFDESFGYYNRSRYGTDPYIMESKEAKRAKKVAKKRKQRRGQVRRNEAAQLYSLYLTCINPAHPQMVRIIVHTANGKRESTRNTIQQQQRVSNTTGKVMANVVVHVTGTESGENVIAKQRPTGEKEK